MDLVSKLARAQAQRGHEVVIYTSDYKLDEEFIASLPEIKIYPLHCALNLAQFYFTPGLVKMVKDNLGSFDIAHLHCFRSFQNIVIHHYARKYGIPYVLDSHGSLPRKAAGETGLKWLLRWLFDTLFGNRILRDATKVIAETQLGVSEYQEFGVGQEGITLIPPPFDTEAFAQLPPQGRFRKRYYLEDKKIAMFLGRINRIKGLDFLVRSFHKLAKARNDARLVIVGNDEGYKATLDKLIAHLNLADKVLFTGFLSGEDKLSALVDADVVIQTSRYEQGAWAPFEAVLCGTPIIVSSNSGAGEDVRRIDAGYLVEFGNEEELARLMLKVLEDPTEATAKAKKAAAYIREKMSITSRIADYERLYAECIGAKQTLSKER